MKVCIALDYNGRNIATTGKGFFAQRLVAAMKKRGVEFVPPEEKADVDLGIGRWQYTPNAKKKILRLGAAHINSKSDYRTNNARKADSLKIADGVIYQSEFSKKVCDRFIGEALAPYEVIPNGALTLQSWGMNITGAAFRAASSYYKTNFLVSTRDWIPQKNLKDVLISFVDSGFKDSALWVAGITHDIERHFRNSNIKTVGLVNQCDLATMYGFCNCMINIVYADACPNNVVEALCSGCWVLSANSGGTPELIKEGQNGNVLPLYNKPYDYGLVDLSKRMKINRQPLVDAFQKQYHRHAVNDYLNIDTIADKYLAFFEKVLNA